MLQYPLQKSAEFLLESPKTGANANIAEFLASGDLDQMQADAEDAIRALLKALRIDQDHNTAGTPARVARMLVRETFSGRYQPMPPITDFPNVSKLSELYTIGPVAVRSTCAHHLCPIEGHAWLGIIPSDKKVVGLSKFARLTNWIMSRPQIQEEATVQLADAIEQAVEPQGLALVVRARHSCMTWRGVRDPNSLMTTSVMRGIFRFNDAARIEFFALIKRDHVL